MVVMFFTDLNYGNHISGLRINNETVEYGVVNEREVRVVAGIMFAIGLIAMMLVLVGGYRELLFIVVPLFWLEFGLKAFLGPSKSILAIITRPLINHQIPEYVGAIQKRFAWTLGFVMASVMLALVFGGYVGWIALSICITCLTLMWLESAAGICLGCMMYKRIFRNNKSV